MKVAVVYKSLTGNTKLVADAIGEAVGESLVYCGEPKEGLDADVYFVGSWTDKGMCCEEIAEFLKTLENKKIAYFGTAGFGGAKEYYQAIFERVTDMILSANEILDYFFCQGKMPMSVRERYVSMMTANPEDKKLAVSVENFDKALSHPDANDLEDVKVWAKTIIEKA